MIAPKNVRRARFFVNVGRCFIFLAILALLGAWITQLTSKSLLSMDQQHFFNDAIVLVLLGIAFSLDALLHSKDL